MTNISKKDIKHTAISRDSLYIDMSRNFDLVYELWLDNKEENGLRFTIPILLAVKLEAFINVVGRLKVPHWIILERKHSFAEKCLIIFEKIGLDFDIAVEPNQTVINIFKIRNALAHSKMEYEEINEFISQEEYEYRSNNFYGVTHKLRSELSKKKIKLLKKRSDEFVVKWGPKLLDDMPEYWLSGGTTGQFKHESKQ